MPIVQKEYEPSMKNELTKELTSPLITDIYSAKKPESVLQDPIYLSPKNLKEIAETMKKASKTYFDKSLDKCSLLEKAKLLVYAINDAEFFGFTYDKDTEDKPKLLEDIYKTRSGDCEELSRFYFAVADALGIENMSQFYVIFRDQKSEKEIGHVGIFYVEGQVIYLDPALNIVEIYSKEFKTPQEVLKDPKFREQVLGFRSAMGADGLDYKIDHMGILDGKKDRDAFYYFNLATCYYSKEDWKRTLTNFKKALEKGVETYAVYSQIAQAHYYCKDYKKAVEFYKKALEKRENTSDYEGLGYSYVRLKKYGLAKKTFEAQLKLDLTSVGAMIGIGVSCINLGGEYYNQGRYKEAEKQFSISGQYLLLALENSKTTEIS